MKNGTPPRRSVDRRCRSCGRRRGHFHALRVGEVCHGCWMIAKAFADRLSLHDGRDPSALHAFRTKDADDLAFSADGKYFRRMRDDD